MHQAAFLGGYATRGCIVSRSHVRLLERHGVSAESGTLYSVPIAVHSATSDTRPGIVGDLAIAFSGRVDNIRDVAKQFRLADSTTAFDCIAAAYARYGRDFAQDFFGDFAIAILDRRVNELVVCRDRLGLQPLFVAKMPTVVWVASDLRALLAALGSVPEIDREGLADFCVRGGVPKSRRTLYRGVLSVEPAHVVVVSRDGVRTHRYWRPREFSLSTSRPSQLDEQLNYLLEQAVLHTCYGRRTFAVDISGGLDSSTVATTLVEVARRATLSTNDIVGCSLVPSQSKSADETFYQRSVAEHLGIRRFLFDIDRRLPFSSEIPQAWYKPAPEFCWPLAVRDLRLFAAARGTRLSGLGGDPLFGGRFPPAYLHDLVRGLALGCWYKELKSWIRSEKFSIYALIRHWSLGSVNQLAGTRLSDPPTWFTPSFRRLLRDNDPNDPCDGRIFDSISRELQYRMIRVDADIVAAGRCSLDERYPLLYWPLVEFMLALPWNQKVSATDDRIIQRRALGRRLPRCILERRTKADGSEVSHRGLRHHWQQLEPLLNVPELSRLDVVDARSFRSACDRLRYGLSGSHWRFFMAVFALERWLQQLAKPRLTLWEDDTRWHATGPAPIHQSPILESGRC